MQLPMLDHRSLRQHRKQFERRHHSHQGQSWQRIARKPIRCSQYCRCIRKRSLGRQWWAQQQRRFRCSDRKRRILARLGCKVSPMRCSQCRKQHTLRRRWYPPFCIRERICHCSLRLSGRGLRSRKSRSGGQLQQCRHTRGRYHRQQQ